MLFNKKYLNILALSLFGIVLVLIIFFVWSFFEKKQSKTEAPVIRTFEFEGQIFRIEENVYQSAKQEEKICNQAKNPSEKQQCQNYFDAMKGEIEKCDVLQGDMKDNCYTFFAGQYFSEVFCNQVSDPDAKNTCISRANLLNNIKISENENGK